MCRAPDIRPLIIYGSPCASIDQSALTHILPQFDKDEEVTGVPLVDLWISAPAKDADVYVYLEHVNGMLRAPRRAEGKAPYDVLGMPWHVRPRS